MKLVVAGRTMAFHGLPRVPIASVTSVQIDDEGAELQKVLIATNPKDLLLEACEAMPASKFGDVVRLASGRNVMLGQLHCW